MSQHRTAPPPASDRLRLLVRALVYILAFAQFSFITADPDLWGHIRFGQDIWQHQAVHATDPFSFTAEGYRWINHEWVMEVLFYLLYHFFDSTGLLIFKALLGVFIVHLLSCLYFARAANLTVYLAVFLLGLPVMAPGFMTRPHLATFLGLALLIYILHKFFDGNRPVIRWTPLLMLFWVNSHGGVVAGLGIFGMVTLVEWLRCFKTGETHGRQLLTWFLLSCPAVLVNPYGYHLWLFFVQSLGAPRAISEWGPVPLWSGQYWQFKLMILLFLASFALPTRKRIWEIVIIVFAAVYGFKHQRHTVLTAIVLIPYLLHQWSQWAGQWDLRRGYDRLSHHFQWAVQGVLGLFILASAYNPLNDYAINNFRIRVDPQMYPKYAAQFMALNRINGNLVVPFDWGEYMIWKFPDSRVSIDGRFRTAYPEAIIQMNQDFARGKPEGLKLLTGYPSFLVLTKKGEAPHRFMENLQGWTRIYQDPVSKIFIRDQQQMPDHPVWQHLKAHGIRHTNAPPPWDFPG